MKPRVLIFIDWFYPAFKAGGPIKSVNNLIANLKDQYDFFVVCGDRDSDGSLVNNGDEYTNSFELNQWIQRAGYEIIYLSPDQQKAEVYKTIAQEKQVDWAYYNSLFSKNFTLIPYRALKKTTINQMIAPRGMLGKGALSIKPFKKSIFLKTAKHLFFTKYTYWHATSAQELIEIEKKMGAAKPRIRIASNLASPIAQEFERVRKRDNEIRLFFLSRVSKKKNLLFFLKILQELPELKGLVFDIYGPIERDGHWQNCMALIDEDKRITYKGEIHPLQIPEMINNYHYMVLPTLHENYGHVIAESLSQARPVLISDQTPWRNLGPQKLGSDISLENKSGWKERISQLYLMDDIEYQKICKSCFEFAQNKIHNKSLIEASRKLFDSKR